MLTEIISTSKLISTILLENKTEILKVFVVFPNGTRAHVLRKLKTQQIHAIKQFVVRNSPLPDMMEISICLLMKLILLMDIKGLFDRFRIAFSVFW